MNIDTTIAIEKPRLSTFIEKMKKNIANILEIEMSRVNIKSTTCKGLGIIGEGKAVESFAVACVNERGFKVGKKNRNWH